MITDQDEYFHERSDDPHWNESGWFGFYVPERHMSGCVYTHHRPNQGFAWSGVILWEPGATEIHDCLWHDFTAQPLPAAIQAPLTGKVFDYTTQAGLKVRNPAPFQGYEFRYQRYGCDLDLQFTAIEPPHDSGLVDGWAEWGSAHFEQAGRMVGSVTVDGDRYDVDCLTLRDRSWGPNKLQGIARGDFPWCMVSEDHGFLVQSVTTIDAAVDPVWGTEESVQGGWYRRDGVTSRLVSGTRRAERDEDGRPVRIHIEATDELGRRLHASGTTRNRLHFPMFGSQVFWNWSLVEWELDGRQGWGELQDFFNGELYRRFSKKIRAGAQRSAVA